MSKFNYEQYYKQLKTMPEPIMASELPKVKLNLKWIRDYAQKKGGNIIMPITITQLYQAINQNTKDSVYGQGLLH